MKKTLLSLALCLCAGFAMAQITYDFKGGAIIPQSNEELWNLMKPYYMNTANEGLPADDVAVFRFDQAITNVKGFFTDSIYKIIKEGAEYEWLADYIEEVDVIMQGKARDAAQNAWWKFAIHGLLNAEPAPTSGWPKVGSYESVSYDTWIEAFYIAFDSGLRLSLPANIIWDKKGDKHDAASWDVALPTVMESEDGKEFKGWYNSKGEMVDSIKAGTTKEHYTVLWDGDKIVTALENVEVESVVTKAIEKGQLVIIRNGVRYNALGAIVE